MSSKNKKPQSVPPRHTRQTRREYPCCQHCGGDSFPSLHEKYVRDCFGSSLHTHPCPKCQVGNVGEAYIDPVQYIESGPWVPGGHPPAADLDSEAEIKKKITGREWVFDGLRMWAADLPKLVSAGASPEKIKEAIEAIIAVDSSAEQVFQQEEKATKRLPRPEEPVYVCCEHCTLSALMGPCGGLHPVQCGMCIRANTTYDDIALLIDNRAWRVENFRRRAEEIFTISTEFKVPFDEVEPAVLAVIAVDEAAGKASDLEDWEDELEDRDREIEVLRDKLADLIAERDKLKQQIEENR